MSKQRLFCTPCSCSRRSYPELAHPARAAILEICILVPRAHDPSGLWQGSRALAGPDFLSMRRAFVSCSRPIRFDEKSVNRGLPVLDQARALEPCHRPEGSWALGTRMGNLGTKLLFLNFRLNCARSVNGQWNAELKRIFPEVFVFPFRWTKVTRALGTRLPVVVVPFRCRCLRSLMSTGSPASHSLRSRSHALRWPNFFHTSLARWEPVRRLVCLVILYHL